MSSSRLDFGSGKEKCIVGIILCLNLITLGALVGTEQRDYYRRGREGKAGTVATEKENMRKKALNVIQAVNTDSGDALLYSVDINEATYICGFQGSFQFIP